MKKQITLLLILISSLMFLSEESKASHAAGGELFYSHVSGNTYQISFRLFRDCTGISAPGSVQLCVYNKCSNTLLSQVTMPSLTGNIPGTSNPNGSPTSQGCPTVQTSCQNASSPVEGYQEWWYQTNFTLPTPSATCDEWRFSTWIGARNPSSNIAGGNFYVEAYLNRRPVPNGPIVNNNSAIFTNALVPYFCINQPASFNNGTVENDGDSLVFSSIQPFNQGGCTHANATNSPYTPATYNPTTNPFNTGNSFNVNSVNGQINFTALAVQNPTISMKVEEYRNGLLIGSVMRDIQLVFLNCATPVPTFTYNLSTLTGATQTANGFDLCPTVPFNICFDIKSTMSSAILTAYDNSSTQAIGSTSTYTGINTDSIRGCISWTPTLADTGLHLITVVATDSTCNAPGILITQVYTIALRVYPGSPLTVTSTAPTCNTNNGSLQATAAGSANTFLLMPNNIVNSSGYYPNLSAGVYIVTLQNGGVCSIPDTLVLNSSGTSLAWNNVSYNHPGCSPTTSGTITSTSTGGTGTITYGISPAVGSQPTPGNFTGIPAGWYAVSATDASGCSIFSTMYLVAPPQLTLSSPTIVNANCFASSDGSISLTATNSVNMPVTYVLNPGNISNTTGNFTGLPSGTYTITATDVGNCSSNTTVVVTAPPILQWGTPAITNVFCYGGNTGAISITATGGVPTLNYNLMPGNVTNATGSFTGLVQGTYTVTVTDANNCTISTTINITQPLGMTVTASSVTPSCVPGGDGSITVTATGGATPYQYNIGGGNQTSNVFNNVGVGLYTVTVTDANNCSSTTQITLSNSLIFSNPVVTMASCPSLNNGSILTTVINSTATSVFYQLGAITNTTGLFTGLTAGTYVVSAVDLIGCSGLDTIIVGSVPIPTIDSVSIMAPTCLMTTGSITVSASGGTPAYQYNIGGANQSSNIFNNVPIGTYTVTVTDAGGCTTTSVVNILAPPTPIITNTASTNVSCNGGTNGTITLTMSGGAPPLSYNLMPGNITNATGVFTNLGQNTYTIIVTDATSCSTSTTITITEPPILTWGTPGITNVSCNGGSDGVISITAGGGTPSMSYNLMPGNITNGTGSFTNLTQGSFTVTVTDANNCTLSTTIVITEPTVLSITGITSLTPSCVPGNDGSITVTANGGTTAYQYSIGGPNQASNVFNNLGSGIYTVTVTDANNCTTTTSVNITAPNAPNITNVASTNVSCNSGANGTITLTTSGGAAPLSYNLMPSNLTNGTGTFLNLIASTYVVTVSDAVGCSVSTSIIITEPTAVVWDSVNQIDVSCNGGSDGSIQASASGGTPTLSYTLLPGPVTNSTGSFANLSTGTYTVTATDANSCTIIVTVTIIQPPALVWAAPSVTNVSCNGGADGTINITASGGTPALSYNLMPGNITNSTGAFTTLNQGSYTVTVTDGNNCTLSTTITVTQPPILSVTNIATTIPSCVPGNDGSITVTATGGTTAYQYNIGGTNQASNVFNGVGIGTYTITVTDANNCTTTTSVNITAPNAPSITNAASTNVSCNGGTNGTITLTATGGASPLSYNLMPSNITNATGAYTNLGANTYTVTVTDAVGCSVSTMITITEPPVLTWSSPGVSNVSCNGGTNGAISITASGGTPALSYNLMPGNITNSFGSFSNLTQGSYTITATDANNCTLSTTITITQPPVLVWATPVVGNVSCNGGNNGAIIIGASGGAPALSYNLMPGNVTNGNGLFTSLSAGSYTVTVTDANNCTISTTLTITQPPVLQITNIATTIPSCVPGNDGSITITATGGTTAYQYNIGGANQSSNVFNNVGSGIYTVTVTDVNNCNTTTSVNITAPNAPNITNAASTNVSCNGGTNGTITLTTSGGTAPISYNLMPGNLTNATGAYTNLGANVYTVTVTDAVGCSASTMITITEPPILTWSTPSTTNVSCNSGNDGSINITASGGTPALSYNLMPGNITNGTGAFTTLTQGSYTVTVTDANNCTLSTTITITQPPVLVWSTPSSTNVSCNGGNDGAISITASGGTPALSYNLMPGNITNGTGAFTTLSQGSYTVTVTDGNNCTLSTTITITQPPILTWSTPSTTNVSCNGGNDGSISITAIGGMPALSYNLMPGNITNGTGAFTTLTQGSYTVTVTDANNCTLSTTITISEPPILSITNIATTIPSCVPGNDGSITVTATGGTTAYQYNIGGANQASNVFNNIGSGIYTVTVTDANNCTITTSVNITAPNAPSITNAASTNVSCNGGANGTITLTATGGASPLSYNLMPGNITNATGAYTNLGANAYTVTVTDALGCSVSTTITITEPPILTWSTPSITNVSCNGGNDGSISITASGGTPALSYNLMPGNITNGTGAFTTLTQGSYTVTVTDGNNCTLSTTITISEPPILSITNIATTIPSCVPGNDGSITVTATGGTTAYQYNIGGANQASNVFNNIGSGIYTVTVTDANNCTTTTSVNITAPNAPSITNAASTNVSCNGGTNGTITLTTSGGTAPISYNLMPGNLTNATGAYTNLGANVYTVTVTDGVGCSVSTTITITEPPILTWSSPSTTNVSCNGGNDGSISITASGGTPALSYNLMPGNITNGTGAFTTLTQGSYTVTVTDGNNCTLSTTITISEPPILSITNIATTIPSCVPGNDGSITVTATGGTTAYQYNIGGANQASNVFNNIGSGIYTVTVTDANNCTTTTSVNITAPNAPSITNAASTNVSCNGGTNGTITLTATGGASPLSYTLMPGNITNATGAYTNLGANAYTVTVTDGVGCSVSTMITITEPPILTWSAPSTTNVSCNGGNDGSISITASGGTSALSYNLMPGNITNATGAFTTLTQGSYTVTVTDGNNCTLSTTITITQPPILTWSTTSTTNVSCNGGNDGSISIIASGGTPALSYNLMPGNITNGTGAFTTLTQGSYTVTVTDGNNCTLSTTITITQPPILTWSSPSTTNVSCNGGNDGSISITASGGTPALSYNLMPGNITNGTGAFTTLTQGSYTVTVTDGNNCTLSTTITISEPPILSITNIATTIPSCVPGNDGSITVTATGGTTAYQYNIGGANQASNVFNNIGSGIYTVTVTDANNCTTTTSVNITAPNAPSITNAASTNVSCNGGTNGTITLTATGGASPLSYTLMPGNITNATGAYTNLGANAYTVTVTDGVGCSVSTMITITEPPILTWSAPSTTNVSCNGGNDGSISITASGGTSALSYNLMPGNITNATGAFTTLTQGSYTVTVTDGNNCTLSTTITITQPPILTWSTTSTTNVSCNGGNDGSISIIASGGTPALSYNLMPGNITNGTGAFTTLTQGSYTVTVTDGNNCTLSTTITISEPPILSITNIATTIPSCVPGNDGSITVTATGGTTAYQYNIGGANQASNVFNNIGSGIYTVTVTDANNCTITTSVNITAPNAPSITNAASTNVSCNGGADGTITLTASGGAAPLSYNLMPGNVTNGTGAYTGLGANVYTVTITDAVGCSVSTSITITEPTQVVWDSVSQVNVSCNAGNDGSLQVNASGGTGVITYVLNPGNVSNTTGTYGTLTANTYTITATDANNCSISTTITITEPTQVVWDSVSQVNVSCNAGNDGSLQVNTSGGTGVITYVLNPGNVSNTTGTYGTLTANTYTITATDANNCSISTTITITEPPVLSITNIASTIPSCVPGNDGSITVTASGGTTAYQYSIGGPNQASNIFTNVGNGIYTVTVTDANNCTTTTSVNITAPNAPSITNAASTNVSCNGGTNGTITLTATGGASPLSYNLMPGNITNATGAYTNLGANAYTVTVTDAVGCSVSTSITITEPTQVVWDSVSQVNVSCNAGTDGSLQVNASGGTGVITYSILPAVSPSNTTGTFGTLIANTYTITATDANNCSISTSITITVPTQVVWDSVSQVNVSCNAGTDGSLQVNASGGTGVITYSILPVSPSNTTGTFGTLIANTYTITATDANNCSISTSITITEPPVLSITNIASTIPSCVPGNDGSITVTASGGTTAYQYSIGGPNQASNVFTNVGSGIYTVTVTDANNCTTTTSVNITAPNAPSITNAASTNVSCNGGTDGTITLTASGGAAPLSYNLMPGNVTNGTGAYTGLGANVYTVTITDAVGCSVSTSITITEPTQVVWDSVSQVNVSCNAGNDGSLQVNASGGTGVITYVLNPGNVSNTTGTYGTLTANTYTITATDANNCSISTTITITEPTQVVWDSVSQVNVSCNAGNDGSLQVNASGGTGLITYVLNPGNVSNTTGTYGTLTANTYTITATDANNCSISTSITITEPPILSITNIASTIPSCVPGNDGSITVTASGGTTAYQYSIGGPNQASNVFTNVGSGIYTVTVTDANNCTTTTSVNITAPNAPSITNASSTNVSCNGGADGTITLTASGGAAPLSYNLMPGNVTNGTGAYTGLGANVYTVTITDAVGCSVSTSITITEPTQVVWDSVSQVNVSCNAGNDGSLQVNASGGTGVITYVLNPGNVSNTTGTYGTLTANTYTITATDANNCSISTTITITEPTQVVWDSVSQVNVSCNAGNDGSLQVNASGGAGLITYVLNPGNVSNTTGTYGTLTANTYTITATDANNCSISTTITITEPPILSITNIASTIPSCVPGNDGSITVTATGGTTVYQYNIGGANQASNIFNNLGSGIYTVTVTDANNCTITTSVNITAPNAPNITALASTNVSCNGGADGTITLTASGGAAPLSYNLMPGNVTNGTGAYTGLGANVYTVTITDAVGCSVSTSITITEPTQVVWDSVSQVNVSCNAGNDGSLQVNASGGTGVITYVLNPGNVSNTTGTYGTLTANTYTITATDANNCSISTTITITEPTQVVWDSVSQVNVSCNAGNDGSLQVNASGGTGLITYVLNPGNVSNTTGTYGTLTANTYTITATDANNCSISTTITITEPPVLSITNIASTIPSCVPGNDGSITVTATGGTTVYQYNIGGANQPSNIFNNLGSGIYTVTVTDANNCTITTSVNITAPNAPSITNAASTNVSCNGGADGTITLTASGGAAPLSYNLMPGNVTNGTGAYTGLGANVYTVTITDAVGCSVSTSITITEPTQVVWDSVSQVNVSCNAGNDGSLQVNASGGTGVITYVLNPGNVSNTTGTYGTLTANTYTITATDANNCSISTTITITEPTQVVWDSVSQVNVSCNAGNDGSLQVNASGGTGLITYVLNPGNVSNTTGTYGTLTANTYTITATDANNCSISTTITITEPPVLSITNIASTIPSCVPGNDGSITVTATGGTTVYQYNIGGANQPSNIFNNLGSGIYTVTVTDANNCTITTSVNITAPNAPSITNAASTNVSCNGGADGTITLTASGGAAPLSYNLMPGNVTNGTGAYTGLGANVYTVTITDAVGCSVSTSITITEPTQVVWDSVSQVNVSCNAGNDGSLQVNASGGTGVITYVLNPGNVSNTTGTYGTLTANTYTITATDANNCSISTTITITEPTQVVWDSVSQVNVSCNAGNDGSLQVNASGGTGLITYVLNPGNVSNTTGTYGTLTANTYTITATDANNCSISTTITITEPPILSITNIASTIPSCVPGNDGSITVTVSGGTTAYQYNIGGANQASNVFTNLGNGAYTVTVTDANNCTITSSVIITAPNAPTIINAASTNVSCNGGTDGTITLTMSGGAAPLSYTLLPGPVTNATGAFTNLGANAYTVTVTDAVGCSVNTIVNITEPTQVIWDSVSQVNVSCNAGSDGSLQLNASGGTGLITYLLNPGNVSNTTGLFVNLSAITYTITATDANNCSISTTVTIAQPSVISWGAPNTTSVSCNGGSDGSLSITASGGTPALSYNLMPGNVTNGTGSFTALSQGSYIVTVTDANNCTISTTINVAEPPVLSISNIATTIPSCVPGNDGSITVTATGGTATYQYNIGGPNQAGNVFTNLGSGNYTVTVSDANNCTISTTVTILTPGTPTIASLTSTAVSCSPGNDGTITVMAANGLAPYQYNIGGANQSNNIFTGVGSGTYTVTVTDANGCTVTSSITMAFQAPPTIASISTTSASCIPGCDGIAVITANSGTTPYTYSLNGINFQPSNTFNGLCANTYTVTVQGGNGCSDTMSFVITTAVGPTISSAVTDSVNCNGGSDGIITVQLSGGTNPISYTLMPGNVTNGTGSFTNLVSGNYTVAISDANGCTANTALIVSEPLPVQFDSVLGTATTCNGVNDGTIYVSNIGGTGAFTYTINPNATFTPPGTFNNLPGNITYVVTAADANGCTLTTSVLISSPAPLAVTNSSTTDVSCNGGNDGTIQLSIGGGTAPYSYNLQPNNITNITGSFAGLTAAAYTITITDANNCTLSTTINVNEPAALQVSNLTIQDVSCFGSADGSIQVTMTGGILPYSYNLQPTNQTNVTGIFANLSGSTYTITITDANNCTLTSTAVINEPFSLTIDSLSPINVSCFGANDGQITVNTSGGNGGNSYTIQPGNVTNTTGIFTNLSAQQYVINVVDSNNCSASDSIIITEPSPLTASHSKTNVSCFGGNDGTITVTAAGGTPNYSFTLNPGNIVNATGSFSGLIAGFYNVTAVDANGCTTVINGIEITQPPAIQITSLTIEDVVCYGDSTGKIIVTATGGTPTLQYSLAPANGVQVSPGVFHSLYAATYVITVTDANNCVLTTLAVVDQNPEIKFDSVFYTEPLCNGDDNGAIEFFASGGVGTIQYAFENGPISPQNKYSNLTAGTYLISAIDSFGCRTDSSVTLNEPDPVAISSIDLEYVSCKYLEDGKAIIQSTGGVGYHTYYVRPGLRWNRNGIFANLKTGYYTIKVVDTNQCSVDSFFTIQDDPNALNSTIVKKDLACRGYGNEGEAEVIITGGEPPLTYLWSTTPAEITAKVSGLRFGWYFVQVMDSKGCDIYDSVYINPGNCCTEIFLPNAFSPNGDGRNDEFRVVTTAGVELLQFEIFNRWGQRVWDTYTYFDGWNGMYAGEEAALGTYYYVYRYRCTTDRKEYIMKGNIILIR